MNTEILNIIKNALGSKFQGKIYLCGGAVRDYILGREFSDYDFSVFHDLDLFREKLISVATDFGEYDNISNTHTFRINNIRMEYSSGHSLSDNIYEDAAHRDFTINSLYYDIFTEKILDPTGRGLEDLQKGIIDTTEAPETIFVEDPSRMLRAVRFSVTLGKFSIKDRVAKAIKENLHLLENIPWEKTESELTKILTSHSPNRGLRLLEKTGILKKLLPDVASLTGVKQNKYHKYDVWEHTLHTVGNVSSENKEELKILRYAALLHDIGKPDTQSMEKGIIHFYGHEQVSTEKAKHILNSLRFSNTDKKKVLYLIENHMKFSDYDSLWTDIKIRKIIQNIGPEYIGLFLALKKADIMSLAKPYSDTSLIDELTKRVYAEQDLLSGNINVLTGKEIMQLLNIKEGSSIIGHIKNYLYDMTVEKKLNLTDKKKAEEMVTDKYKQYLNLPINGTEIINHLGIKPGKTVGRIISYLKDKIIDGSLDPDDREKAFSLTEEFYNNCKNQNE